jgi:hypothetical protein
LPNHKPKTARRGRHRFRHRADARKPCSTITSARQAQRENSRLSSFGSWWPTLGLSSSCSARSMPYPLLAPKAPSASARRHPPKPLASRGILPASRPCRHLRRHDVDIAVTRVETHLSDDLSGSARHGFAFADARLLRHHRASPIGRHRGTTTLIRNLRTRPTSTGRHAPRRRGKRRTRSLVRSPTFHKPRNRNGHPRRENLHGHPDVQCTENLRTADFLLSAIPRRTSAAIRRIAFPHPRENGALTPRQQFNNEKRERLEKNAPLRQTLCGKTASELTTRWHDRTSPSPSNLQIVANTFALSWFRCFHHLHFRFKTQIPPTSDRRPAQVGRWRCSRTRPRARKTATCAFTP